MSFFLPYHLTPQGWLTDMLLAQIYHPNNTDLYNLIHKRQFLLEHKHSGWLDTFFQENKLAYLHPTYKNFLETKWIPLASAVDPAIAAATRAEAAAKKEAYVNFLMNVTPAQQALFIPYIRMYIKHKEASCKGSANKCWKTRDIIFREFTDVNFILQNKFARGGGTGIRDISVTRRFDYFGLTNDFRVAVDYFFSSMSTFARGHPVASNVLGEARSGASKSSTPGDYIKIIEPLGAGRTKCVNGVKVHLPEEKIFLEYGWKLNPNTSWEMLQTHERAGWSSLFGANVFDKESFLEQEKKTLELKWIKHDFSFKENGEIDLKVEYVGAPIKSLYETESLQKTNDILEVSNTKLLNGIFSKEEAQEINQLTEDLKKAKRERKAALENCEPKKTVETKQKAKCKQKNKEKVIKETQKKINKIKKVMAKSAADILLKIIVKNGFLFKAKFNSGQIIKKGSSAEHHIDAAIAPVHTDGAYGEDISFILGSASRRGHIKKGGGNAQVHAVVKQESWTAESVMGEENTADHPQQKNIKIGEQLEYTGNPTKKALADAAAEGVPASQAKVDTNDPRAKKELDRLLAALTNSGHSVSTAQGGSGHEQSTYGNFFFFPLRALIACAYALASEDERKKMPIVCLGNMAIRSMDKPLWINIGDILVEVGVFNKWVYESVIQSKRTFWTFGEFLDSVINTLVPQALHGYSTGEYGNTNLGPIQRSVYMVDDGFTMEFGSSAQDPNKIKIEDFYFAGAANQTPSAGDVATAAIMDHKPLRSLAAALKKPKKGGGIPFILYHQQASESSRDTGITTPLLKDMDLACRGSYDRKKDHKDGLYHLHIGEDKGLLNNINFSYEDDAYLRSALLFDKGQDGTLPFLKYTYSAQPTMWGNNLYTKGAYFAIPINPLGVSEEEDPGLRGYYRINQLVDNIAPGKYTTTVRGTNMGPSKQKCNNLKDSQSNTDPQKKATAAATCYVTHNMGEYIINDLLDIPSIKKAYNLKKKLFDPCDPGGGTPEERGTPQETPKCPKGQVYDNKIKKCRKTCTNGFWWGATIKKCYCPKKKIIVAGKCVQRKKATKKQEKQIGHLIPDGQCKFTVDTNAMSDSVQADWRERAHLTTVGKPLSLEEEQEITVGGTFTGDPDGAPEPPPGASTSAIDTTNSDGQTSGGEQQTQTLIPKE